LGVTQRGPAALRLWATSALALQREHPPRSWSAHGGGLAEPSASDTCFSVQHGEVRLAIQRSQSTAFALGLLAVGALTATVALGFLGASVLDRNAGGTVGTLGMASFAWLFVPAGVPAWRIARSRPAIVVTDEGVTIEDQGLFARPVHLPRGEVHSVYVGPLPGEDAPPRFYGRGALRRSRQWHKSQPLLPISSWHCPDLSLLPPFESHNLLIVVSRSMPMRAFARRGLGSLDVILARGAGFHGPTRATVARGFFAFVVDEDQARQALASYPTAAAPDPELWDWLFAGTNRGFGWLGWRSRRAAQQRA
jgi:hypothetical protein